MRPGIATLLLGLPFVLAGGGLTLGPHARRREPGRRASVAMVLGAFVLLGGASVLAQVVDKLVEQR